MKHLITAGLVLAALLLTACGREVTPVVVPPVDPAPVVIDIPVTPPPAVVAPVTPPKPQAPKRRSKPHRRQAPRPMVITPQPAEPPAYEEFCFVGRCVAPPYRMEN